MPFSVARSAFRTTLARELGEPLEFYEISLDEARFQKSEAERPFVQFLESRIANRPMDLVVTVGGPGMRSFATALVHPARIRRGDAHGSPDESRADRRRRPRECDIASARRDLEHRHDRIDPPEVEPGGIAQVRDSKGRLWVAQVFREPSGGSAPTAKKRLAMATPKAPERSRASSDQVTPSLTDDRIATVGEETVCASQSTVSGVPAAM